MNRRNAFWILLVAVCPVACGGGGGAPHCGQLEPCGGDVLGSWKFAGGCANSAAATALLMSFCPGASIAITGFSVSGTITFKSDGTYDGSTLSVAASATETIPLSCSSAASCAALVATPMPGVTASCTGTTTCTCRVSSAASGAGVGAQGQIGTYSTLANSLSLQGATTSNTDDYCVQGDELHFVTVDTSMNMGPMGMATITEDVVAIKQ